MFIKELTREQFVDEYNKTHDPIVKETTVAKAIAQYKNGCYQFMNGTQYDNKAELCVPFSTAFVDVPDPRLPGFIAVYLAFCNGAVLYGVKVDEYEDDMGLIATDSDEEETDEEAEPAK